MEFDSPGRFVTRMNNIGIETVFGRAMADETGLSGRYDVKIVIRWDKSLPHGGWESLPDTVKPLGLAIKPMTLPFPLYTIEGVHRPPRIDGIK